MPKSTPESDYIKYMATLQSKIRAEEVGLQSWHGAKRVQIAPMKMNIDDTLTAGDKLSKSQKLQTKMLDEYLEKQKGPIIRYDEFGDIIGEFKFHDIPPPELEDVELDLPAVTRTIVDRDGVEYQEELRPAQNIRIPIPNIDDARNQETLRYNNNISAINRDRNDAIQSITALERELLDTNDEIIQAKQIRDQGLKDMQAIYDRDYNRLETGPKKGRSKAQKSLIRVTSEQRKRFLDENDRITNELRGYADFNRQDIKRFKDLLTDLQKLDQDVNEQFNIISSQINKVSKENNDKIKEYESQLKRMNTGAFNIERRADETELEYADRLVAIANEPYPTERNQEKANQLNKEELRENLSTLFRDRSMIEEIVNTLDLGVNDFIRNIPEPVYLLNTQFEGFKDAFVKRFGEFNKNVKVETILDNIARYLERREINLDNMQVVPYTRERAQPASAESSIDGSAEVDPSVRTVPRGSTVPSLAGSSFVGPRGSVSSAFAYEEDPETGLIPSSSFVELVEQKESVPTIEPEPLPNKDNVQTLRFIYPTAEGQPRRVAFLKRALVQKDSGPPKVVPFVSDTGLKGSYVEKLYRLDNTHGVKEAITNLLGTANWLGNDEKKNGLQAMMDKIGLEIDNGTTVRTYDRKGALIFKGLGLKMSDSVETIPTIVNFGLIFLLLKKLYLHNTLSIQNKHYKKVNGFNNLKVSDTFVEIIQDILNEKNYISKLSQLSTNEREVLDHLLYVAGLHKQLNGGSTADYNKLKKQLEVLQGEIVSGNNNVGLKKQLFNLLQKMAHYKMISSHGAQKHFKQFEQYFK